MNRLTDPGYIPERIISTISNKQTADLYEKLCLYENTGLYPEEISVMMAENTALIEQLKVCESFDADEIREYTLLYDSIHILQNGGILDEEEVQVCEHNLLFQIIGRMNAGIRRGGIKEL